MYEEHVQRADLDIPSEQEDFQNQRSVFMDDVLLGMVAKVNSQAEEFTNNLLNLDLLSLVVIMNCLRKNHKQFQIDFF